ncbi:MAG: hypothetical protein RR555_06350, partial [Bacteroidales bacterium]
DTRIFSPLLYQLSYGTFFLRTFPVWEAVGAPFWDCKDMHYFLSSKKKVQKKVILQSIEFFA